MYATVCQRLSVFASVVYRGFLKCLAVFFSACLFQCLPVCVRAHVCVRVFSAFQCFSMLVCCCLPVIVCLLPVFCCCLPVIVRLLPAFATVCQGLPMPGWCAHTCFWPPTPPLFVVFIRSKTNGAFNDLTYYFGPFSFAQPKKNAHTNTLDLLPPKGSQAL